MTETSKERRAHPRFAIQGATVRYLIHGPDVRESDYPISYPLMELSRGGMSFITESALKPESALSISLSGLRMEETLRMTGRVVYCRASEAKPSHYYKDATFKWLEDRYWERVPAEPAVEPRSRDVPGADPIWEYVTIEGQKYARKKSA